MKLLQKKMRLLEEKFIKTSYPRNDWLSSIKHKGIVSKFKPTIWKLYDAQKLDCIKSVKIGIFPGNRFGNCARIYLTPKIYNLSKSCNQGCP